MIRVTNTDGAGGYCVWCGNTGTLWLLRWEKFKAMKGHEIEEQVTACCGFCELGHAKHMRYGGPWSYELSEVDVILNGQEELTLGPDEVKAYEKMKRLRQSMRERRDQLQLPVPRPPQLDADALDTVQDTDTLTVKATTAESPHLITEEREPSQ